MTGSRRDGMPLEHVIKILGIIEGQRMDVLSTRPEQAALTKVRPVR